MLTLSQLQAIKTWVNANAGGVFEQETADLLNSPTAPAYQVWRSTLALHDLTDQPDVDTNGTTPTAFTWGGAQGGYIARSEGERSAFHALFNTALACKPYLANVRTAFNDIFSGAGAGAVGNRAHIWARGQRAATVVEKLLAVQTVGGPTQTGNRGTRTNPDTVPENVVATRARDSAETTRR